MEMEKVRDSKTVKSIRKLAKKYPYVVYPGLLLAIGGGIFFLVKNRGGESYISPMAAPMEEDYPSGGGGIDEAYLEGKLKEILDMQNARYDELFSANAGLFTQLADAIRSMKDYTPIYDPPMDYERVVYVPEEPVVLERSVQHGGSIADAVNFDWKTWHPTGYQDQSTHTIEIQDAAGRKALIFEAALPSYTSGQAKVIPPAGYSGGGSSSGGSSSGGSSSGGSYGYSPHVPGPDSSGIQWGVDGPGDTGR